MGRKNLDLKVQAKSKGSKEVVSTPQVALDLEVTRSFVPLDDYMDCELLAGAPTIDDYATLYDLCYAQAVLARLLEAARKVALDRSPFPRDGKYGILGSSILVMAEGLSTGAYVVGANEGEEGRLFARLVHHSLALLGGTACFRAVARAEEWGEDSLVFSDNTLEGWVTVVNAAVKGLFSFIYDTEAIEDASLTWGMRGQDVMEEMKPMVARFLVALPNAKYYEEV